LRALKDLVKKEVLKLALKPIHRSSHQEIFAHHQPTLIQAMIWLLSHVLVWYKRIHLDLDLAAPNTFGSIKPQIKMVNHMVWYNVLAVSQIGLYNPLRVQVITILFIDSLHNRYSKIENRNGQGSKLRKWCFVMDFVRKMRNVKLLNMIILDLEN